MRLTPLLQGREGDIKDQHGGDGIFSQAGAAERGAELHGEKFIRLGRAIGGRGDGDRLVGGVAVRPGKGAVLRGEVSGASAAGESGVADADRA